MSDKSVGQVLNVVMWIIVVCLWALLSSMIYHVIDVGYHG